MRRQKKTGSGFKLTGIIALIVAFLIGFAPSIGATSFLISDSNPESYIAVVMLMLPLAILFTLKERFSVPKGRSGIAAGLAVFALYAILFSYLRLALGYAFITYRVDALLSPLLLASMALVLFGIPNLKRFIFPLVFALFASPAILLPIVSLNGQFTASNAQLVYGLLRFSGLSVGHNGLIISSSSAIASISISSTCTDLGLFIALAMLLAPLAYLFDGGIARKVLWVASGIALMLLFNIGRMYYIAYQWMTSGISAALTTFHAFAGVLLFYAAIIIIVLSYSRYGLSIRRWSTGRSASGGVSAPVIASAVRSMALPITIAILIGLASLTLSLPSVSFATPQPIATQISATQTMVYTQLESAKMNVTFLGDINISASNYAESALSFALSNATVRGNSSVFVLAVPGDSSGPNFVPNDIGHITKSGLTMLINGIVLQSGTMDSGGAEFYYTYFVAPTISKSYPYAAYMFYLPVGPSNGSSALCSAATGVSESFESTVYNLITEGPYGIIAPPTVCAGYAVASSI